MFATMRIGIRLGLAFGIMLALLLGVTTTAIVRLDSLDDGTSAILSRYPKTVMMATIKDAMNQVGRSSRNALLQSEPLEITQSANEVDAAVVTVDETLAKLDRAINTAHGRELYGQMAEIYGRYAPLRNELVKLIRQNKKSEATNLLLHDVRPLQLAFFSKLDTLTGFQGDLMNKTGEDAKKLYLSGRKVIFLLSGVAVFFAFVTAFAVTSPSPCPWPKRSRPPTAWQKAI